MGGYSLADYAKAGGLREIPGWAQDVKMAKVPRQYQIEALRFSLRRVRSGDYSDPGLGKSLPAQALALLRAAAGNKTVVLTPPRLNLQFFEAMQDDYAGHPLSAEIYGGGLDERQALTDRYESEGWPDILVMAYRTFTGPGKERKRAVRKVADKGGRPVNWRTFLARGYTMLIVDEAICIKSAQSQIHKACQGFVGRVEASNGLLLMSGQPLENTVEDLYGFLALLSPLQYGSFRQFERRHCVLDPKSPFRKVLYYDNLDELHKNLYATGRRVAKADVLDLPPVTYADVPVVLSKPHKALYEKLVEEMLLELPDGTMLDFTQAGKLYQATQRVLFSPESVTGSAVKDNAMLETLDELVGTLEGRKVMIGVWYQETVELLMRRLQAHNPVALYGGNTPAQTEAAKRRFIGDPACTVAITNFRSGGVGVDGLQTVCSHAVMAELIAVPGLFQQWVSRLDRSGQKEPVTVYLLVPKGTVAVKIRQSLLRKDETANTVIHDKKQLLKILLGNLT